MATLSSKDSKTIREWVRTPKSQRRKLMAEAADPKEKALLRSMIGSLVDKVRHDVSTISMHPDLRGLQRHLQMVMGHSAVPPKVHADLKAMDTAITTALEAVHAVRKAGEGLNDNFDEKDWE